MEEGASPPRIALDKKLEEDALMEEKKERRGEPRVPIVGRQKHDSFCLKIK